MTLGSLWENLADKLVGTFHAQAQSEFVRGSEAHAMKKTRILSPEEDIRRQINAMNSLEAVWKFVQRRVASGSPPSFMAFSVVDHPAEVLRIRFLYPADHAAPFQGEFIPLCDRENHFVRTVLRGDTTFTSSPRELGQELAPFMALLPNVHNIFSIPLIAGNRTIATLTLGFEELDGFSRSKLSSVYILRDQLAPLVWNLILLEQLESQPPLDAMTQLPLASQFEPMLAQELRRAQFENDTVAMMLVDIHQLKRYNQQYSPQQGDQAILRLVHVLKRELRGLDQLCRVGGDKIAVISPGRSVSQLNVIAESVLSGLQEPYRNRSQPSFQVSIGIAGFPADGKSADTLRRVLETTLDLAKYQTSQTLSSTISLASQLDSVSQTQRLGMLNHKMTHRPALEEGSIIYELLTHRLRGQSVQAWTGPEPSPGVQQLVESLSSTLQAIQLKVPFVIEHALASSTYAVALADTLGLSAIEIEKIRLAALLQNVGYIGLTQAIVAKPGMLTPQERREFATHPTIATERVLSPYPDLADMLPAIEHHHEAWDGTGYPLGLRGESIPLAARIVSIADAFCALITARPHRPAYSMDDAIATLRLGAGSQWDPKLVNTFIGLVAMDDGLGRMLRPELVSSIAS